MRRGLLMILLLVLLVSVACDSKAAVPTVSPLIIPSATAIRVSSPTLTLVPPNTPTSPPTATSTPMPKPTLTLVPHPTPGPTLTKDEEQTLVLKLLKENSECRLPCWWGFTPGETAWLTAEKFFLSHGKRIGRYYDSQGTVYSVDFFIPNHGSQINQDYYTTKGDVIDVITVRAVPAVHDEKLDYGDAQLAGDGFLYMLSQMLTTYGQPSEVLLETFTGTPDGGRPPFSLLLFYPEKGILVRYHGPAEKTGKTLRLCPSQADVGLVLWSPESSMTLDHLPNLGNEIVGDMSWFRSLEEATGMSVEQFYQSFARPNNKRCLETPADMW
jgi:hypothetical protein